MFNKQNQLVVDGLL